MTDFNSTSIAGDSSFSESLLAANETGQLTLDQADGPTDSPSGLRVAPPADTHTLEPLGNTPIEDSFLLGTTSEDNALFATRSTAALSSADPPDLPLHAELVTYLPDGSGYIYIEERAHTSTLGIQMGDGNDFVNAQVTADRQLILEFNGQTQQPRESTFNSSKPPARQQSRRLQRPASPTRTTSTFTTTAAQPRDCRVRSCSRFFIKER